jgi:hypothetical protein
MKLPMGISALNEQDCIAKTIARCLEARNDIRRNSAVTDIDISMVSDGSTDHLV